jgi:hypothetical protein
MVLVLVKAVVSIAMLVLPGYLTRVAWLPRMPRDAGQDALSFWGEVLLFGLIWAGGWGVLLAQVGWFSLLLLWLISALYCAGLGLWLWRRRVGLRVKLSVARSELLSFLALLLVAGALFFRPHEFILGGADAGVYVNLGANIARTGAWRIQEPLIAELPVELYPALFREQPAPMIPQYVPLPGTYLTDDSVPKCVGEIAEKGTLWHPVGKYHFTPGVRESHEYSAPSPRICPTSARTMATQSPGLAPVPLL